MIIHTLWNQRIDASAINWVSPLKNDDFAEYRDSDFLKILSLEHLQAQLKNFWPTRGTQWDALGKSGNKYYLVEAKANIPEINSACQAKSPSSVSKIKKAISDTKLYLNIENGGGWLDVYYQYANSAAGIYEAGVGNWFLSTVSAFNPTSESLGSNFSI